MCRLTKLFLDVTYEVVAIDSFTTCLGASDVSACSLERPELERLPFVQVWL